MSFSEEIAEKFLGGLKAFGAVVMSYSGIEVGFSCDGEQTVEPLGDSVEELVVGLDMERKPYTSQLRTVRYHF